MESSEFDQIVSLIFAEKSLLSATLSSPQAKSQEVLKVQIRPVSIKGKVQYQISEHYSQKVLHKNLSKEECENLLRNLLTHDFKQGLLCTAANDYHILVGKKRNITVITKPPSKTALKTLSHNIPKQYLLQEGTPVPFLAALGIMNSVGKVFANKRDKFKQMNRFLEIVSDILPALEHKSKIHIIDFGCGKAYLTFALYHYLHNILKYDLEIVGLDLKQDVIAYCQSLADKLAYRKLQFVLGDINGYQPKNKVDLVVTLHACDTATDAALEKAVRWNADVILSVPCCQHELFTQVQSLPLNALLQHGILKERFAALATDAARGKILELLGYAVQIIEFIDMEHTPKNIMIRAVRKKHPQVDPKMAKEYNEFKQLLNIYPSLEQRFINELKDTLKDQHS